MDRVRRVRGEKPIHGHGNPGRLPLLPFPSRWSRVLSCCVQDACTAEGGARGLRRREDTRGTAKPVTAEWPARVLRPGTKRRILSRRKFYSPSASFPESCPFFL